MKKLVLLFICFISILSKAQTLDWAKRINYWGDDVASDANKNVYSFNKFNTPEDLDPGPGVYSLTPIGGWDICLSKLDSMGNLISVIRYGSISDEAAKGITIDEAGYIYLHGSFSGTIDFDPGPGVYNLTSASTSNFLLKFDSNLNLIWANTAGATWMGFVVDNSGIYLYGSFNGLVDFDPGAGTTTLSSGAGSDCFVSKWTTSGTFSWVKRFDGSMSAWNDGLCLDSLDNIYLAGQFMSTYDFDPGPGIFNMTASSYDCFFVKLDASGNFIYAKTLTSSNSAHFDEIRYDSLSGQIITMLTHNGTIDADLGAGATILTAGITYATAIVKYDLNANLLDAISINGGNWITGVSMAHDQSSNLYVCGNFKATVDMNPGPGINTITGSTTDENFYLLKLDSAGNYIWALGFVNVTGAAVNRLHLSSTNELYLTGFYYDPVDFDPGPMSLTLSPAGGFLMKILEDPCSNTALIIDSVSNVGCLGYGVIASHLQNGASPCSYAWSSPPVSGDSLALFDSTGIYQIVISDANGCLLSTTLLLGGIYDTAGYDLRSHLIVPALRQGIPASIFANGYNFACTAVSGYMRIAINSYLNINSVFPAPDSVFGTNVFMWNFNNIKYGDTPLSPVIIATPSIFTPDDYVACNTISMFPLTGDNNPANNSHTACVMITNSHDPNRIDVDPIGNCEPHYVLDTQLLTYTIQFQNNGNADAINIYLLDTLDSDLDLYSVRILANSHPMVTEVLPGNVLKFRYDNIMLPDSTSDEEGSHGYVIYEVKPLPSLSNGTVIENYVGIYFDFNPPVYTNTVFNTINDGTFFAPVTTTTLTGVTITSDQTGMLYQWIDCTSGDSISGATNQSYIALQNGSYAVIISDGCDSDTSECALILTTGINNFTTSNFSIYPNPSQNNISISTNKPTELFISNLIGEIVIKSNVIDKSVIDISQLNNGVYFIRNSEGNTIKFIKQ